MARKAKLMVAVAGLFGAAGVATAAVAAHVDADPRLETASTFLILHAAALLGAAAASRELKLGRIGMWPAWGIALGTLLFCGDLIVRVLHGSSPLPLTAPIGGTILILSWLALGLGTGIRAFVRRTPA